MKLQRWFSRAGAGGLFLILTLGAGSPPPVGPQADFDGDGYADLAIGVPGEDVIDVLDGGAINVVYGSDGSGLTDAGNLMWHQNATGMQELAETSDNFGTALAVGDFDGDGYVDLAVGVPYEELEFQGAPANSGAVHVMYGSHDGLNASRDQLWSQDSPGIEDEAEEDDWFGQALAAGDFDGDGYDDLAVGVPFEDLWSVAADGGSVHIMYGSRTGVTAADNEVLDQYSGIGGQGEDGDQFGYSLAVGDFDGDRLDDLVIGVPGESYGPDVTRAGMVHLIYGSHKGSLPSTVYIDQDSWGIEDEIESEDVFGWALAAGDFNGDGFDDLGIGVPGEDYAGKDDVGAVHVVYGPIGWQKLEDQFWHQDVEGTEDAAEEGDRFGRVLTTGDFNRDGFDDLAVGIPYEDAGSVYDSGAVHVFYGSSGGLTKIGDWWFDQDTSGVPDEREHYDYFGSALAASDFNGDGYADLAIGVPYENVGAVIDAGAVNVVYGWFAGLAGGGNQFWHQNTGTIDSACENHDRFGSALAALKPKRHKVFLPLVLRN